MLLSRLAPALLVLVAALPALAQEPPMPPRDDPMWRAAEAALTARMALRPNEGRAKNVILFIGDGMGVSTITAIRIFDGQSRGNPGEENALSFERFPYTALVKTYNVNAQVPDSAGTASAIMTGLKTNRGVIDMAASREVATCGDPADGVLPSLAERAAAGGRAIGVVTTARLTHATPATVYAHSPSREWEADVDLSAEARENGCTDIAAQLIAFSHGEGVNVAMGGGRANFLPREKGGRRGDGRDLVAAWRAHHADAQTVTTAGELAAIDPASTHHLLGLFADSHMAYEAKRGDDQPSLAEMTRRAIDILAQDDDGFFLMVEGGRIDHAHHAGRAALALRDGQAFADAVTAALARVNLDETLIIVTADHSHVFTIAGYPARGNPILGLARGLDEHGHPTGKPLLGADGKPYTTLGYWDGPGALAGERPDLDEKTVTALDYRQQAAVPLHSETHGGEDVAAFAVGPWAHLVGGVMEQNLLYHVMARAMALR
ncbi:MAG: alkaline phosphatase [Alphaproteobacteria bacterium]|nr:MAG: alkaline phosphatase [Alphaproteobacteria bacterium]